MSKKRGGEVEGTSSKQNCPSGHIIQVYASVENIERPIDRPRRSTQAQAPKPTAKNKFDSPLEEQRIVTSLEDIKPPVTVSGQYGDIHASRIPLQDDAESSSLMTRPVIAVSASRGPAAFFNLARKFLATNELCDLSALEGAIVSAVDAAHLLERSQLATIVRVQTSYVTVEPKRKTQQQVTKPQRTGTAALPQGTAVADRPPSTKKNQHGRSKSVSLRRARIIITVKRTEDYKLWLIENPQNISGEGDELDDDGSQAVNSREKNMNKKPPAFRK